MGMQTFRGGGGRSKSIVTTLGVADTGGGVVSIENPEGVEILITEVILIVATKSTGACTLDIGVAAGATTSGDNIIDGVDVNAATGKFDNVNDASTNGGRDRALGATQFITASMKTGAAAGLAGQLIINYVM